MTSDLSLHTLADIPRAHARTHPERRALAFEGRDTTYGELDERASRVAQALAARGLRAGDRIAYLGKNSDRYYELLFGAARAGVVMTPVN
jgi:long-chain acyl-CoA synthetase